MVFDFFNGFIFACNLLILNSWPKVVIYSLLVLDFDLNTNLTSADAATEVERRLNENTPVT